MLRQLARIVHRLDAISEWSGRVLVGLVFVMMVALMYEVIARHVFNSPTSWALELATMTWGAYGVLAGAYILLYHGHIANSILYERWSKRRKAIVDSITFPLVVLFAVVLLWKGMHYGIMSVAALEHSHSVWGPPVYGWKLAVPVGAFLLLLQGISKFIRDLVFAIRNQEL